MDETLDFVNFLSLLSSADNNLRSEAEFRYKHFQTEGGDKLCLLLLQVISCNSAAATNDPSYSYHMIPSHIRKLATILLRRLLIEQDESAYRNMTSIGQETMKQGLIRTLDHESDTSMLVSITDLAGELAGYIMEQNEWPELLPYSYKNLQSTDPIKREMGLNILGLLSNSHIEILISSSANIYGINTILSNNMVDPVNDGRVMLAAIRTLSFIISSIKLESELEPFQVLLKPMMNGLSIIISSYHQSSHTCTITETMVISYIDIMIELVESRVAFIEYHLRYIIESLLEMISIPSMILSIRRMMLELIVTICLLTPKKLRKIKAYDHDGCHIIIRRIINICIELMGQIPDDPYWETSSTIEDSAAIYDDAIISQDQHYRHQEAEMMLNADCGETSLDRILPILGINCTVQPLNQAINTLLSASYTTSSSSSSMAWKYPYVGFRVLSIAIDISSYLKKKADIISYIQYVIQIFENFMAPSSFHHLHPRVVGAMFFAMSRFIATHGKFILDHHHHDLDNDVHHIRSTSSKGDAMISSLTIMLQFILAKSSFTSISSPRIRRYIMTCLINLIDVSPPSYLDDKAHAILSSVLQALSEGPMIVQEQAILCIISLSETIRSASASSHGHNVPTIHMSMYYDSLMPILKSILSSCHMNTSSSSSMPSGLHDLWGQTFECCAILGESSGIDKFHHDAIDMMTTLVRHIQADKDMNMNKHLMKAWVRIAKCLGHEMMPYLPSMLEKLSYAIIQDPSENTADLTEEDIEERSDIHMVEHQDGSWTAVRTAVIEEQALSCQLLSQLIERLQDAYYPHVEQTLRMMIPLLKSPHDDIRSSAMIIIPEVIRSTAKATSSASSASSPDKNTCILSMLLEHVVPHLLQAIEAESELELVLTGMASLKLAIHYACVNWHDHQHHQQHSDEPPELSPFISMMMISSSQLDSITSTAKILLKESLQRRSVMRAEAVISGDVDDDDMAEEEAFMMESFELHYAISEIISIIFKTHGELYIASYMSQWHDFVCELIQPHCIKEDQEFGLFIICDVIEYGLSPSSATSSVSSTIASSYLNSVIPMLITILTSSSPPSCPNVRQPASYAIKLIAEKHYDILQPYTSSSLQALGYSIASGDEDGAGSRGKCTDNAVAAVGTILEQLSPHQHHHNQAIMDVNHVWNSWISYLPLKDDTEEGYKVNQQLIRLISSSSASLSYNESFCASNRWVSGIKVLIEVYHSSLSSSTLDYEIAKMMQTMRYDARVVQLGGLETIIRSFPASIASKADQMLSQQLPMNR